MPDVDSQSGKTVVIVAGEASGDLHGARLAEALHQRYPDISICGAGGHAMVAAGVEIVIQSESLSVMGFSAVFTKLPVILKAMGDLKRLLAAHQPDLLILIDFPDFNLRLASWAKKFGIPVLYYISPTVWAWRAGRIKKIRERVDHMAVILPFEAEIYRQHGVPVTFVGHPLLDASNSPLIRPRQLPVKGSLSLALLPGSREGEVTRLLPRILDATALIQREMGSIDVVVSHAPSLPAQCVESLLSNHDLENLEISSEPVENIFDRCHFAIIASGTASLEAAIVGLPMVIVYATSTLNYLLAKRLIKVPHIGLANLIARKRIVPELIQEDASAENIARTVLQVIKDASRYHEMSTDLLKVLELMGKAGAADRVARIAGDLMDTHRKKTPDNGLNKVKGRFPSCHPAPLYVN